VRENFARELFQGVIQVMFRGKVGAAAQEKPYHFVDVVALLTSTQP
jgi:hypothetical protein